jgi:hypothetical protein
MGLGEHERDKDGRFRRERGDSLAKNLRETYPEFAKVRGDTRLDTLRKRFGVESVEEVRRAPRKQR